MYFSEFHSIRIVFPATYDNVLMAIVRFYMIFFCVRQQLSKADNFCETRWSDIPNLPDSFFIFFFSNCYRSTKSSPNQLRQQATPPFWWLPHFSQGPIWQALSIQNGANKFVEKWWGHNSSKRARPREYSPRRTETTLSCWTRICIIKMFAFHNLPRRTQGTHSEIWHVTL